MGAPGGPPCMPAYVTDLIPGMLPTSFSQAILKSLEWIPYLEPGFGYVILGVDGISIFFIILTALLIPICVLISFNSIRFLVKEFLLCLLFIEVLLIGVFLILDLVGFYILFEGILIPMFLIIGI